MYCVAQLDMLGMATRCSVLPSIIMSPTGCLWLLCRPLSACVHSFAGYYEDGEFGIRIENLLVIKEAETPFRFGDAPYLNFERLTMCPLQRKMIDLEVHACNPAQGCPRRADLTRT